MPVSEGKEKIGPHSLAPRELRKHAYFMKLILYVCTPLDSRAEGSMRNIENLFLLAPMPLTAGCFRKRKTKKMYSLSSSLVDDHYIVQKILHFLPFGM